MNHHENGDCRRGHRRNGHNDCVVSECSGDCEGVNCTTAGCNRSGCGCVTCPPGPPEEEEHEHHGIEVYGMFAQNGQLMVSAGSPIPYSSHGLMSEGIERNNGVIRVFVPGVYLVTFSVTIPKDFAVNTVVSLRLNNSVVTGAVVPVTTSDSCTTKSFFGQAIVQMVAGDRLSVVSSASINVTATDPSHTLATLSIIRLT